MSSSPAHVDTLAAILSRGRIRGRLRLLGPAFVAAVAYVDPGNFATNFSAGATSGYLLLWVIVVANLMAVVVQYLSSKVGLVTGRSLPELCRARYPAPVRWFLWVQAEIVAMATDLAEFIGAAVALDLLFGWPPLVAGIATAIAAVGLLTIQRRGWRRFEIGIAACLGVIIAAFAIDVALVDIVPADLIAGLVPRLGDDGNVLLAVGIVGATVMPHVVYLHSALVTERIAARDPGDLRFLLRYARIDVVLAMVVAGAVNASMLVIAAALRGSATGPVDTLADAHALMAVALGPAAAAVFAVALLASGLSSSSVGTLAGQVVMQGFIDRRIPIGLRRLVTIVPAMAVLAIGAEPTFVLILSQVVLSIGIPFALVPLVHLTGSRSLMGEFTNGRRLTLLAGAITVLVVAMNVRLLAITLGAA